MRVLIIEDDQRLARLMARVLGEEHIVTDMAFDGDSGLELALRGAYDVAIVDWMLPGRDGPALCRAIRSARLPTAILMLTARSQIEDRVTGLDSGADDYLTKPFAFEELLARIRVQLRRRQRDEQPTTLHYGPLTMDTAAHETHIGGRRVDLTAKEYELLELFMRHPQQVLTREVIYDRVWGYDFGGESNIIEVYVRYLRQKLEAAGEPRLIHTVRGVGYILREEPAG